MPEAALSDSAPVVVPLSTRAQVRAGSRPVAFVVLFTATSFTASVLLFLVQPMFARLVLPQLGGSPSVWNACMLFFQTALLIGYLYAHLSTRLLGAKRQASWHGWLLLLPALFLPLSAGSGVPEATEGPVWWLLRTLAVTVGVPFFVLATSAPLLQRWFVLSPHPSARDPYFLYSASNLGSMVALLGYPFAIEPGLGLQNQTLLWTAGYIVFAILVGACILMVRRFGDDRAVPQAAVAPAESLGSLRRVRWTVLSFAPSSLMLGVTAHVSTDIAAVPLLWVLPLALYLLTFVLAFSDTGASRRKWLLLFTPPLIVACLVGTVLNATLWWFLPLHLITFFCASLVCHRLLAESRPHVSHLTEFYLWISFGGMLGGVFNTLLAPHVFSSVLEYPLVLSLICLLVPVRGAKVAVRKSLVLAGYAAVTACLAAWILGNPAQEAARAILAAAIGLSVPLTLVQGTAVFRPFTLLLMGIVAWGPPLSGGKTLFTDRSFFGVMRVIESADQRSRTLRHGSTLHGYQRLPADGRCEPSSYYHPDGPVGDVFRVFGPRLKDVAVVGLGTGAMGCYATSAQHWTFYEIDPLVQRIARDTSLFTHMQNGRGDVDVVIGDGRIKLREVPAGHYDMIVVDAFSSDSIPVHLLTVQAVQLYMSRLRNDGVLAIHVSNRYLALEPVVAAIAAHEGLAAAVKSDGAIPHEARTEGRTGAHWMALSRDPEATAALVDTAGWRQPEAVVHSPVWTDDYSNIFRALR